MRGPSHISTLLFQVNFKPYITSYPKLESRSLLEQCRIQKTQKLNVIFGLERDGVQEQMLGYSTKQGIGQNGPENRSLRQDTC